MTCCHGSLGASSGRSRYPRAARLHREELLRAVMRRGDRCHGPLFDCFTLSSGEGARTTAIVPRHGRTAVARNKLRRRVQHLLRTEWLPSVAGRDILLAVRAKPAAYEVSYERLKAALRVQWGTGTACKP